MKKIKILMLCALLSAPSSYPNYKFIMGTLTGVGVSALVVTGICYWYLDQAQKAMGRAFGMPSR